MIPTLRPATPADVEALAALKYRTFRDSFVDGGFAIPYPPADLSIFEAENFSIDKIASELADRERMNWVVESESRLLGYAQAGPVKLPHPDCTAGEGELYQLYVLDEAQGLKVV